MGCEWKDISQVSLGQTRSGLLGEYFSIQVSVVFDFVVVRLT